MKKNIQLSCIILMIVSCNIFEPKSNDDVEYSTITTSNILENSFYIDFTTSLETTMDGTWQISFQMIDVDFNGQTYPMPSLILNSSPGTIMAAIYDNISFEELSSIPSTFSTAPYSDALSDLTSVQYGGNNEIIGYDMTSHVVSINNPNEILLIYSMSTHQTWKIQFIEYNAGLVLFKFNEM